MGLSKGSQAYVAVRDALKELQEGVVMGVDPSIGSHSSMPGWAVYRAGELVASGTFDMDPDAPLQTRLQRLTYLLRHLIADYKPDVLVYEMVSDVPFKGFAARGLASLQKALGAILSVSGPDKYVGMLSGTWKKYVRPGYVKGDEQDAIELAWVAIEQARQIAAVDPKRRVFKRKA